jgi:hypothetical protein
MQRPPFTILPGTADPPPAEIFALYGQIMNGAADAVFRAAQLHGRLIAPATPTERVLAATALADLVSGLTMDTRDMLRRLEALQEQAAKTAGAANG